MARAAANTTLCLLWLTTYYGYLTLQARAAVTTLCLLWLTTYYGHTYLTGARRRHHHALRRHGRPHRY